MIKFSCRAPSDTYNFTQAIAAAPAPLITNRTFSIFFFCNSSAFSRAAPLMIAVPCWSSCITGIESCSRSSLFYIKTFRRFDIFEVNAAKSRLQGFYNLYKFLRIGFIYLDIKYINIGKYFKQYAFAFHYRFACFGANIAQTQYRCTIADDGYQVAFGRIFIYIFYIIKYFFAGLGNARAVSQR